MDFHYKYNVSSVRLEYKILNELADFFNDLNIIYHTQFQVLSYKIDIYLSTYNLAIEIDEVYHKYRKGEDEKRQTEIENELQCDFVRIEENDSVGNAIAKIMNKIAVLKTDKNIA